MPKKSRDASPQLLDEVYDSIKQQIDLKTFQAKDLVHFATLAMRLVEGYPQLSGPEKKNLVIQLANRLVAEIPNISQEDLAIFQSAISLILPSAIDYIIAASKGQLDLNITLPPELSGCFGCCIPKAQKKKVKK